MIVAISSRQILTFDSFGDRSTGQHDAEVGHSIRLSMDDTDEWTDNCGSVQATQLIRQGKVAPRRLDVYASERKITACVMSSPNIC